MTSDGMEARRQRIYPNGSMELVIHLTSRSLSFFEGATRHSIRVPLLAGPYSRSFEIDPAEFTAVLGVRFKPGTARLFFPVPAHELHNIDIPLVDLYPAEAERLLDELLSARELDSQLRVLERYLSHKLSRAVPMHPLMAPAVRELVAHSGMRAIADVRFQAGLSHTRFIQLFRESVGMTPKLFCRLQRFRGVLERVEKGLPVKWAALAADCGYFDQAHLIHDFRHFSGLTPAAYARLRESSISDAQAPVAAS